MAYIKSHSNYVIKEKHQLTNDGTIFERDMSTIGGLSSFPSGQVPIYQSGNFIISVNNDLSRNKDFTSDTWEKNGNSDVWTLNNISDSTTNKSSDTNKIVLKQDFYNLADFAYYGSCSELIRASITDIINKFPGELYAPIIDNEGIEVYYRKNNGELERLGGDEDLFLVDNPFNIDLHTLYVDEEKDPLKYFANNGCLNYTIIKNDEEEVIDELIFSVGYENKECYDIGDKIATITINNYVFYAFLSNNSSVVYLTSKKNIGVHIRPLNGFYEEFFDKLDSFQKVLMNRYSKPMYTATFEIINENSFGYETTLKNFTFPTTYGDYNLAVNTNMFSSYLDELAKIASFYDEVFCDNLYRNMTHESIKNFDWSYSKEYEDGDDYSVGGSKIQKLIRLIGREFDEIKQYIDNINNNYVSYGDGNNLADYFLTDTLNNEGWEVLNIYPFNDNGSQNTLLTVTPYKSKNFNDVIDGYVFECNNGKVEKVKLDDNSQKIINGLLYNKVSKYTSDKVYSMSDVNNHFLKMLKLNSRNIFRHKGTIEGIEMILGMFGLKSKKFIDNLTNNERFKEFDASYDYDITEYTSFTPPIVDTDGKIDSINRKKTIAYNTKDYINGIYHEYQGLPVRYSDLLDKDGKITARYLYPYFSPNKIIDGNPYYQMKGGWMYNDINKKYTETIKNIISVKTVKDLLSTPYKLLNDGDIYHVENTDIDYLIVNSVVYDIYSEYTFNNSSIPYIKVAVSNHSINVGNIYFYDNIKVSSKNNTPTEYDLTDIEDGVEIKIYIKTNYIEVYQDEEAIISNSNSSLFSLKNINNSTSYFKLINKSNKNKIGGQGWVNLSSESDDYKNLSSLKNNFKGNNPHKGNYDNGMEYMSYFISLFKYALENDEFDQTKFNDEEEYNDFINRETPYGFEYLKNGSTYKILSDSKVHHFCNLLNNDGSIKYFDDSDGSSYSDYNLFNISPYNDITDFNVTCNLDQIINTKRVDITFKLKFNNEPFKKYLNDVIFEYLSNVIPMNTILHLKFE
ncbi:MAG: hypothetical protein IKT40_07520 [Bacilli bacterium]|nr:hypothetical protein [Bacilli bacterium]